MLGSFKKAFTNLGWYIEVPDSILHNNKNCLHLLVKFTLELKETLITSGVTEFRINLNLEEDYSSLVLAIVLPNTTEVDIFEILGGFYDKYPDFFELFTPKLVLQPSFRSPGESTERY